MIDCASFGTANRCGIPATRGVDWQSPEWGMAGHNVHESSTGSWLEAESDE